MRKIRTERISSKKSVQTLRITSGELRGRELKSPMSEKTHPMGSRERLGLFNSLGPDLMKNAIVLDAFAGTGSLGFEALSRGAAHVTFVEKNHKAATVIRENAENLGVSERVRVLEAKMESLNFDQKFDVVFCDPPYDLMNRVSNQTLNRLTKMGRMFVLSHPADFDPHQIAATLKSTRAYAAARISIFG